MNDEHIKKSIGKSIQLIRLSKNLTQEELASSCELSDKLISRIETGTTDAKNTTMVKLMKGLKASPTVIFASLLSDNDFVLDELITAEYKLLNVQDKQILLDLAKHLNKKN